MQKQFSLFCAIGVAAVASVNAEVSVNSRVMNDGNLILEDIPEIDSDIIEGLRRYQNVRSAPFRGWTAEGEGIYISTRFGDVSQIHLVKTPGGARHQLTFFDEPVSSVRRNPKSDDIVFLMDSGGNENAQIMLMDSKTGNSTMISDGSSRYQAILWSPDGEKIAYQCNQRNGASNDVWMMDVADPDSATLIWEAPDNTWWGPAAWSEDGKHLLIQQYVSASESFIYLLDLESGESQLLEGSEDKSSSNFAFEFSKDGRGYFFSTNRFSGQGQLAYREFGEEAIINITEAIPWSLEAFTISEKGDSAAFVINEDGISKLYLLDPESFEYEKVQSIPVGLIGSLEFSPNGKSLGLTLNTAQTPSDSYVLELKRNPLKYGDLERWTYSEVGGLNTEHFAMPSLVRYESFDGLIVPAFVYKPEGKGPFPVVISIHGGPESQARPGFSSTYQQWIQQLGVAVVVPNVRGSAGYGVHYQEMDNGYQREDSVKDIGALLDWIETQPSLDSERVAVFGGSYGGYMVLASSVHFSDRLKAAVDVVGISNFVTFLKNTQSYRRDLRRVEYGDERDDKMREFLESISPNNHVEKIQIPMLVIQGQNDPRVPVTEAEQVVASLRENGKTVWYMNAMNEGHGYRKKENRDVYQQAVVQFFKENL